MEQTEEENMARPSLEKKIKVEEEEFIKIYKLYKRENKVTKEIDLQLLELLKKNCKQSKTAFCKIISRQKQKGDIIFKDKSLLCNYIKVI